MAIIGLKTDKACGHCPFVLACMRGDAIFPDLIYAGRRLRAPKKYRVRVCKGCKTLIFDKGNDTMYCGKLRHGHHPAAWKAYDYRMAKYDVITIKRHHTPIANIVFSLIGTPPDKLLNEFDGDHLKFDANIERMMAGIQHLTLTSGCSAMRAATREARWEMAPTEREVERAHEVALHGPFGADCFYHKNRFFKIY